MKESINTATEGKGKATELLLGVMGTCLLQEMVFGCSGLMPQCEWVPHDSYVDITTDCPYGIAVIAPSSTSWQHLEEHRQHHPGTKSFSLILYKWRISR